MKTSPSFKKSLHASAAFLCALFLNPYTGMAQYAGAGVSRSYDTENTEMVSNLGQIGHNIMLCSIGAIVLLGIGFIFYMVNTYNELGKPKKKLNRSFLAVLALVLGTIGSSCSPAQKARAEQYRQAMAAEQRICPMNHNSDQADAGLNNAYSYSGYSTRNGPVFCKRCGQRIFRNH